jgi:serine/threonine-protein kinase
MAQLMYKIANEHAPDILKYNPSLSPALVAFLDTAMSKEAGARYQTGEEFAAALRSIFGATAPGATRAGVDISL